MCTYQSIILTFLLLLLNQPPSSAAETARTASRQLQSASAATATCPSPSDLILIACNGTASLSGLEESCIQTLVSDHRTATASTAAELVTAAVLLATEKAKRTAELIGSPTKPVFKSCAESYAEVAEALRNAERLLRNDGNGADVEEAEVELGAARESADYCDMLLTVDKEDKESPVYAANKEVYGYIIFVMSAADLL